MVRNTVRMFVVCNGEEILKREERSKDFLKHDEEHQKKRSVSSTKGRDKDFMDVLMSICEHEIFFDYNDNTLIKATVCPFSQGVTPTCSLSHGCLLLMLGNNGIMLKKVRDELDEHVRTNRIINESDIKNLVYLQAVNKEALRLYPAGPPGTPRVAIEDCTLVGYHIPTRTHLVVNLSKIQ